MTAVYCSVGSVAGAGEMSAKNQQSEEVAYLVPLCKDRQTSGVSFNFVCVSLCLPDGGGSFSLFSLAPETRPDVGDVSGGRDSTDDAARVVSNCG